MSVSFGKYKGWTYEQVYSADPSYVRWIAGKRPTGNEAFDDFRGFCVRVVRRTFVYVLACVDSKYYIGTTSFPVNRLRQHRAGQGSAWTRRHRPLRGYLELKRVPDGISPGLYEDMWVKQYMLQHGVHAVRGGSYSQVDLNATQLEALHQEMRHAQWNARLAGLR